ncbi:hypothetical protein A8950_1856 [Dongia mobilis]|uniref:Uncharacterized protein n=1 Tax=Dongia mobilis TaxID=578943 RepID=A0A4R6WQJ3_9PROT|nr:hypothetical protein [Dongia mobilis]TDQ82036.1 hypothetical protein A8950_1856 [Dongia mobilis]
MQKKAKVGDKKIIRRLDMKRSVRRARPAAGISGGINPLLAMRELPRIYERMGDCLLDRMHRHAGNPGVTRSLSRQLDWVGTRAQLVNSFIAAGDGALGYLCAESLSPERLASLVELTARHVAEERLPVALFLMEKIDEELRLA